MTKNFADNVLNKSQVIASKVTVLEKDDGKPTKEELEAADPPSLKEANAAIAANLAGGEAGPMK